MLLEQAGEALQHLLALPGRAITPDAGLEGPAGSRDCAIDIGCIAGSHLCDHLSVPRRDVVEGFARNRIDKSAVDKGLALEGNPAANGGHV